MTPPSHPDREPAALRTSGLGPQRPPPVRRRRPDGRRSRPGAAGEPAEQFQAGGLLSDRVSNVLQRIETAKVGGLKLQPARIEVADRARRAPGAGRGDADRSGGFAPALGRCRASRNPRSEQLAGLSERGRRSGVGLHGFLHGGLLVDGGHRAATDIPPLVARMDFPPDWSILIIQPPGPKGRHGHDEIAAFAELPPFPERVTERLCRLVLLDILSAVAERDLTAFGAALSELQHHVGTAFAPAQGGVYASPAIRVADRRSRPARPRRRGAKLVGAFALRLRRPLSRSAASGRRLAPGSAWTAPARNPVGRKPVIRRERQPSLIAF